MPPRKKFTRKRFKRRSARGGIARKAMAGVRFLRSIVNVEKHFFGTSGAAVAPTVAGVVYPVDNLLQGDVYNSRSGNSILVKSFYMMFDCVGAGTNQLYRLIIFIDKENRGALPAVTDVLETATSTSPMNHINGKRFKVLRDARMNVSLTNQQVIQRKWFIKLNHHVRYNDGNTGTVTDFREGHIFWLFLSDTTTGFYAYNTRIRYIDN